MDPFAEIWDQHILPYMRKHGFSPDFLRIDPTLTPLPADIIIGSRPDDNKSPNTPEKILRISAVFYWSLEPEAKNIQRLVDYLEYKVPLPGTQAAIRDTRSQLSQYATVSEIVPIQVLFHRHHERKEQLAALVRDSPREFLDILRAVGDDYDTKSIQLFDCLYCLDLIANDYLPATNTPTNWPLLETTSEADRVLRELVEEGLPRIFVEMVSCASVLSTIPYLVKVMRALVTWCTRKPLKASQARAATTRSIMSLLDLFWDAIWTYRNLLLGSSTPMYLVYYIVDIDEISEEDTRVYLSLLVHDYALLSNSPYTEQPSRDAYMTLCRVMTFIWLNPAIENSEPRPETWTTILGIMALFAGRKYAALTPEDLNIFADQEIYAKYGAKLFLTNLGLALRAPDGQSDERTHGEDARGIFFAIETLAIRAECKPYYVSSGLLQSIREVFDDPLLRALSSDRQWLVYRDAIEILDDIIALAPTGKAAKALLRGHNIFALISQSIGVYGDTHESHADSVLVNIICAYIAVAGGSQARGGHEEFLSTMTLALRAHWYPVIRNSSATVDYDAQGAPTGKVVRTIEHWIALGKLLGLEIAQEKELYERRAIQMCAWNECQYHDKKPPTPTRACAGCGEVRYCSRPCQKSDWKTGSHSTRCKRIKENAHNKTREAWS